MGQQLRVGFECAPVREMTAGPDGPSPTVRIVRTIAELEGVDTTELPPLGDAIDSELVDKLVASNERGGESPAGLCFTYCGWNVFVHNDGTIIIGDPTEATRQTPWF